MKRGPTIGKGEIINRIQYEVKNKDNDGRNAIEILRGHREIRLSKAARSGESVQLYTMASKARARGIGGGQQGLDGGSYLMGANNHSLGCEKKSIGVVFHDGCKKHAVAHWICLRLARLGGVIETSVRWLETYVTKLTCNRWMGVESEVQNV